MFVNPTAGGIGFCAMDLGWGAPTGLVIWFCSLFPGRWPGLWWSGPLGLTQTGQPGSWKFASFSTEA